MKSLFYFVCNITSLVLLTWSILILMLGVLSSVFPVSENFSIVAIRYIFLFLPIFTVPIFYKYFQNIGLKFKEEKKAEVEILKNKIKIHSEALKNNMSNALKLDDYGKIVSNSQDCVIEDFLNSVDYQKHLLKRKEAKELVVRELRI